MSTREELEQIFGEAHAAVDQAKARALALLDASDAGTASTAPAAEQPDWGTIGEASGLFQRSPETTAKRVAELGLGVFENGRWRVDLNRVRAHLSIRPYAPLQPYAQANSGKFGTIRGNSE